ncbi:ketohexokinase-like isoform X2 [Hyalella azteca]|uniref:Ketohexokinase-like isoform X2 n=1 Tax=Hyalella azteca TaxID=294128 RepID=A0A8B7NKW0_HYAAZ|nr:ketohexokinase-like isoform X2 [Hyalella azteca]
MSENTCILCVGLLCLDIVSECEQFPKEDDKVGTTTLPNRCVSQKWQRGGNASNTSTVLALLGDTPTLACTLANSPEKQFLVTDMAKYGIKEDGVVYHDGVACPSSVVICSLASGSRTIIHSNQNLPELSVEDFKSLPLHTFSWVHFEGRNLSNVLMMQQMLRRAYPSAKISSELEKVRPDMDLLTLNSDVIFVSKDYARHLGYEDMKTAAQDIAQKAATGRCRTVIVPWGEDGASGYSEEEGLVSCEASVPQGGVVETLAAGDTFIGAALHALSRGKSLKTTLEFSCRVAGLKVGLKGYEAFGEALRKCAWVKEL